MPCKFVDECIPILQVRLYKKNILKYIAVYKKSTKIDKSNIDKIEI